MLVHVLACRDNDTSIQVEACPSLKFTEVVEEKLKILIVQMTHIPILEQGVCTLNKIIKVQFFFD